MEARLVITRKSPKDIKIRGLFVHVDGEEVGNVQYGETFEMALTSGKHKLHVTNRLYSRDVELDLQEGEVARFEGANVFSGFWAVIIGWSGLAPYKVLLERVDG